MSAELLHDPAICARMAPREARSSGDGRRSPRICLHPALADPLHAGGFDAWEHALALEGETVSEHRRTRVTRLAGGNGLPPLYLKVFRRPPLKDGLSSLLRTGSARSLAEVEWRNLERMADIGLGVPVVVAAGWRRGLVLEQMSFLVTVSLERATCLPELLPTLNPAERRTALTTVARAIGRMHAVGCSHPDLYARHIYLGASLEDCILIDVERVRFRRRLGMRQRSRDLAALHATLGPELVSDRERARFLACYRRQLGAGAPRGQNLLRMLGAIEDRRRLLLLRGRGRGWETAAEESGAGGSRARQLRTGAEEPR